MAQWRAWLVFLSFGSAPIFWCQPSGAEPNADASAPPPAAPERTGPDLAGFELLASAGYGASTGKVRELELAPYGATFGLDLGYTFPVGFRVGAAGSYGLGRTLQQRHEAVVGDDFDFSADSSSLNLAATLGYDVPLHGLVLRYSLGLGGTFMDWDLGGVPRRNVLGAGAWSSPTSGFFVAPGLALLWQHRALQTGVGFDYFVQATDKIPPGLLGKVVLGVKL